MAKETGIPYQVLLAIPGNETGWGQALAGNNYFGIKGSNPKTGANTGQVGTWEVVNGQRVNIQDTFRAYTSYEESARDFADFLKVNPRYDKAVRYIQDNPEDWRGFVRKVHDAGYATDPEWSNKIVRIGNGLEGAPSGRPVDGPRAGIQSVIDMGLTAVGSRYQWGGAGGRTSFGDTLSPTDCSGFVAWAYQRATGVTLPAQTSMMIRKAVPVSADEAAPGDLIFYNMNKGVGLQHVGIYMGNGQMLHDSSLNPSGGVDVTPMWGGGSFYRVPGVDPSISERGTGASTKRNMEAREARRKVPRAREIRGPFEVGWSTPEWQTPEWQGMGAGADIEGGGTDYYEQERQRQAEEERIRQETLAAEAARSEAETQARIQQEEEASQARQDLMPDLGGRPKVPTPLPGRPPKPPDDRTGAQQFLAGAEEVTGGALGAIGETVGGAFSALGSLGKGISDALEATPPIQEGLPAAFEAATTKLDEFGRSGPATGAAVSGALEATPGLAEVIPAAAEKAVETATRPEVQALDNTVRNFTSPGRIGQGAVSMGQHIRDHGINLDPAWEALMKPAAPGSILDRSIRGESLDGVEQGLLFFEMVDAANQARVEAVRQQQPPEVRDTLEGRAVQEAFAFATDPLNVIGAELGAAKAGRLGAALLDEADDLAAGIGAATAKAARDRAAATLAAEAAQQAVPAAERAAQASGQASASASASAAGRAARGAAGAAEEAANLAGEMVDATVQRNIDSILNARNEEIVRQRIADAAEAAQQAADAAIFTDDVVDLFADVGRAVARPYEADEQVRLLQHAALTLNDSELDTYVKQIQNIVATGNRFEALSGSELRKQVLQAVARSGKVTDPDELLRVADEIFKGGGTPLLSTDALVLSGRLKSRELAEMAATKFYGSDLLDAADQAAASVTTSLKDLPEVRQNLAQKFLASFGPIPKHTPVVAGARGSALGAAGFLHEEATGDEETDPNHTGKALFKGLVAFGLGAASPYLGMWASRTAGPAVSTLAKTYFAPAYNLTPAARDVYFKWVGRYQLADYLGAQMEQRWLDVFEETLGNPRSSAEAAENWRELAQHIELNDNIDLVLKNVPGTNLSTLPGGIEALEEWRRVAALMRNYGIIEEPLTLGGGNVAKQYIPHTLDDEWREAVMRSTIELGKGEQRANYVSRNPFYYYNQQRKYATLVDGTANGVTYSADLPHILGSYYRRGIEQAAHSGLVRDLEALAAKNDPDTMNRVMREMLLQGEDVVRAGDNVAYQGGYKLSSMPGFARHGLDDVVISRQLYDVLNNVMGEGQLMRSLPVMDRAFDFNGLMKQNVLSGIDIYHLLNEMRQMGASRTAAYGVDGWRQGSNIAGPVGGAVGSAIGGAVGTGKAIGSLAEMFLLATKKGGFEAWREAPQTKRAISRAIQDGLELSYSVDRPDQMGWMVQWQLALANAALGGVGGYSGTLAMGGSNEDAIRNAVLAGGVGGAITAPVFSKQALTNLSGMGLGPEHRSMIEHMSRAMWDRWIPWMKLNTYEMYTAAGVDGRAAAEFTNEMFGGQNLMSVARSRNVQDAMRLAILAPDWQEGWARSAGNALFNWQGDTGTLARQYWGAAAVQGAITLEMMNLAFGGHWSWQNEPGQTLMVDASRFYDTVGWDRTDPRTGQTFTPYWDVLGPFRSLLEPTIATARWATTGAYSLAGYDSKDLPKEIRGEWGDIPRPDPARDWYNFLKSRGGLLVTTVPEALETTDFRGRPIDREDDPEYQSVINRLALAANRMVPAGQSDIARGLAKGQPAPEVIASWLTGHRTRRTSPATEYQTDLHEWLADVNTDEQEWQRMRDEAREKNKQVDAAIELIQAGLVSKNDVPAKPGESNLTSAERTDLIENLAAERRTLKEQQFDLLGAMPEGPEKETARAHLLEMQQRDIVSGRHVPADIEDTSLDMNEIMRQAWMRNPAEVARLRRTGPPPPDTPEGWLQQMREVLDRPPGYDDARRLQQIRALWLTDTARKEGIDPAVLQDYVKAQVYQAADAQGGFIPMPLPGVTSYQLDQIVDGYQVAARTEQGKPMGLPEDAARARQEYIMQQAQALGVDPIALTQRVKLRTMPLADATEASIARSHAIDVLQQARYYKYVNEDGSPMGTPALWTDWDQKLEANRNRFEFVERAGKGAYLTAGGTQIDQTLTDYYNAKQRAEAQRWDNIRQSEHRDDFYRWFGDGANLTDAQWKAYTEGTLDMWADNPPPYEAKNRIEAMRIWATLTPDEQQKYGQPEWGYAPIHWEGIVDFGKWGPDSGSLARYMKYINGYKTKKYELGDIGQVDPTQPRGVPLGAP